ncbi:PGF-CTERM sorting domain-containing protein [Halobacteriales archaeon QS_1_68_17]|nr:MAG: PGF-CTERM sorting domain-containing protein [Halobacteriales archaeon QS_1_68_17]
MRFATVALAFAALSMLAAPVGATGQDASQVTLTVSVVTTDGEPVSGATLNVSWSGGSAQETTRSNGQALVDVPAGADATIEIDHPRYVRNNPYVVRNASQGPVEITVARAGTATVTAVDADGDPLGNAIVLLRRSGSIVVEGRTDSNGEFTTRRIEQREYALVVYKPGYLRNRSTLAVTGNVARTARVERGSVTVATRVTDDHFDPPRAVEGATVAVEGIGDVATLSDGEATIQVPVNTRIEMTVSKPGYENLTREVQVREGRRTLNVTITRRPSLTVEPLSDRVVVGERARVTVRDEYGSRVAGATVTLDGEQVGETDANGEATVRITETGPHEVTVRAESLMASATVRGVEAATPTATPTATPSPTATATSQPDAISDVVGPGFTPATAAVAVLVLAGLGAWRRLR